MAHALGLRATSFVAATALLGLATIGALTMTWVQQQEIEVDGGGVIRTVVDPPPPPPSDPVVRQTPDTRPIVSDPISTLDPVIAEPQQSSFVADYAEPYSPPVVSNPQWVRRPRDLARYYPPRALERGMEARVVMECAVSTQGLLNCSVVSETPENWGFGDAALRISRDYQMVPAMRDGLPIAARYRLVAPFELN